MVLSGSLIAAARPGDTPLHPIPEKPVPFAARQPADQLFLFEPWYKLFKQFVF